MNPLTNITDTVSAVHLLKINGFPVTKALDSSEYISSKKMSAGRYHWEVLYYPCHYEHGVHWVALRLVFLSKDCKHEVKAALRCRLIHDGQLYTPSESKSVSFKYTAQQDCGPALLIEKRDELPASHYFSRDSFIVECTITMLREPDEAVTNVTVADPCCNLHLDLGKLLLSKKGADVKFVVAGESFLAHKIILAARSPVFMVEFFGTMKESSSQYVEIKDMEASVFKAMLNFIYTGTLPELDGENFDSDMEQDDVTAMRQHLLVAADRYGLDRLKVIYQKKLHDDINVENVATTFAFAVQHGCLELKEGCTEFMIYHSNLDAVMATEGYKVVMASCPTVFNTLIRSAVGRTA